MKQSLRGNAVLHSLCQPGQSSSLAPQAFGTRVSYFAQGHRAGRKWHTGDNSKSVWSFGFPYSLLLHLKNAEDILYPENHSLNQLSERKTSKWHTLMIFKPEIIQASNILSASKVPQNPTCPLEGRLEKVCEGWCRGLTSFLAPVLPRVSMLWAAFRVNRRISSMAMRLSAIPWATTSCRGQGPQKGGDKLMSYIPCNMALSFGESTLVQGLSPSLTLYIFKWKSFFIWYNLSTSCRTTRIPISPQGLW